MRVRWAGPFLVVVFVLAGVTRAQYDSPIESLVVTASKATTWVSGGTDIALLEGPITVEADKNHMTAQCAVMWITSVKKAVLDQDRVEIALIGDTRLWQADGVTRSGPRLYVDARVRGTIRLVAERVGGDRSGSEMYRLADLMRPKLLKGGLPSGQWIVEAEAGPTSRPSTRPVRRLSPVSISAESFITRETPEGVVAAVLTGKVALLQKGAEGDVIELLADRAVVFTPFQSLMNLPVTEQIKTVEQAVTGVYLEGDVRVIRTPANPGTEAEQRLTANRAYYDFTTDRAVLTDVVLYTHDLKANIPIVVRAQALRQLSRSESMQEFEATKTRLSSSTFHTPSYSIGASSAYIRQTETGSELYGTQTDIVAKDATFRFGDLPVFYLPAVGATVTERSALYGAQLHNSNAFGFGVNTEWGLFESMGRLPPRDLSASYKVDYYSKRGPAGGIDAKYSGGFIERTLEPWSFTGDLTAYGVYDHGEDVLGRRRFDLEREEDEFRGRVYWQHQHFFPGDWQLQLSGGYISDPTFQEEWFNRDYRTLPPRETSLYLKRQRDSEAITFLTSWQLNDFVTAADLAQEQFEVERPFEVGYRRVGDSVLDDSLTFFSANTVSALRFRQSNADPREDLGLRYSPGLPSLGTPYDIGHSSASGAVSEDVIYRGDFKQEIDWPFSIGKFRAVPYIVGRYTPYSEGIDGSGVERTYGAGGLRLTTSYWKVDDTVRSEVFDLNRLRHVIEPTLNLYAAAQSSDPTDLYVYDEPIDNIRDISAMQWALYQRWQTKRGGPGAWRSVDVFTLNLEWNYFFNQPPEVEMNPIDARGMYFVTMPEASIPRRSVNMSAAWQASNAVRVLGDAYYNTEHGNVARASIGFFANMAPQVTYYVGLRHVDAVTFEDRDGNRASDITINGMPLIFDKQDLLIFAADYALTAQYRLRIAESYDFAQDRNARSAISLIRKFDRFYIAVGMAMDHISDENSVYVNFWPEGLQPAAGSQSVSTFSSTRE